MKVKYYTLSLIVLLGNVVAGFSQKEVRSHLRSGNKQYNKEHYTEAEIAYRKALEANSRSTESTYNLGNALYKQGKFQEALEQYQTVLNNQNKEQLAKTWHNIGNISMNAKDYAKSIDAYKNALINNPNDNETRYNLALAQKLLSEQQQEDQNQDQNQDQDKNQDKQEQKDQEKKQDEQKQDQQNQDKKDQEQQNQQDQQQQNTGMDKQKAEQILEAMSQDEKRTQDKVKEEEAKRVVTRSKPDKDW